MHAPHTPNQYGFQQPHAVAAADAPVAERVDFLRKTYTWLLMGILGFCGTVWAVGNVPAVGDLAMRVVTLNPLVTLLLLFGASYAVHAVAERSPINVVAYAAYVVMFGLLIGPWIAISNADAVSQAAMITALIFVGLTSYVFVKGHDFSFLGGILSIVLFGMIAVALAGWLFGFSIGIWFSVLGALLFAGYILYDTSRILHHYPSTAHVTAAVVLFVDVVLLFKHLLVLLNSRD